MSLAGIAEADETFFLGSLKGKKRGMPRAPRKRGGKASKRGLSDEPDSRVDLPGSYG